MRLELSKAFKTSYSTLSGAGSKSRGAVWKNYERLVRSTCT